MEGIDNLNETIKQLKGKIDLMDEMKQEKAKEFDREKEENRKLEELVEKMSV